MHELFLFALDAAGRFFPKSSNPHPQCAKKVLSDSLGLEDFAIWLASFVLSLPDGQVKFSTIQITEGLCIQTHLSKTFGDS